MSERVVIAGFGANTPVGQSALASAAAARAGISGFTHHPTMTDAIGAPMRVSMVSSIDTELLEADRLAALLFPALDEMSVDIEVAAGLGRTAIALALPSPRPGLPADIEAQMLSRIRSTYRKTFRSAATFAAGHAGGLTALHVVVNQLMQGAIDVCVVAGVDSYMDPLTLEWVEDCGQLHGSGALNNAWGFIPGESGAAVLVMRESTARSAGLTPLAVVLGVGVAHEPKAIKTRTVCLGEGLTQAFRSTLGQLPPASKVTDIYCDMNGEPYRADELGFATLRTKEFFANPSDFNAPADCWGDLSAAGSVMHLILATVAGAKGYAKGPMALVWASAETGERAAALLATGRGH
jgi:3-oxoacyl-[acyl-carrier-protein] synthase-1